MPTSLSSKKNELDSPTVEQVELEPYASLRETIASIAMFSLNLALKGYFSSIHHVGSTAVPRIHARPIIDLMAVSRGSKSIFDYQQAIVNLGYRYLGNQGVVGQSFYIFDDTLRNRGLIHLHCFQEGNLEIERRLKFRDYLRANSEVARAYDHVRLACVKQHADAKTYRELKRLWIEKNLPNAIAYCESATK